jgi:hypothetical protein
MYPLFFSVSSKDVNFAEEVWKRLPDDWVYIYSKSGAEGVHMWDEISRIELPKSRIFVYILVEELRTGGRMRARNYSG